MPASEMKRSGIERHCSYNIASLCIPVSAFTAEIRAQKDGAAGGHGVMTAEQALYIPADEL